MKGTAGSEPASKMPDENRAVGWHHLETVEVLDRLRTDRSAGLSIQEVARRRSTHGPNALVGRRRRGEWSIVWGQIREPMVLLLIVAAIISATIGEHTDAIAILAIVVLSGALGFVQEYRAERAMAALKRLAEPEVNVRRGGSVSAVPAHQLVPGDVVVLEAGNRVPADGRVLDAQTLQVQEAALTGEAHTIAKHPDALPSGASALGDRRNMVYMGTDVVTGRAEMIVVETGMRTELGRIAELLQSVERPRTPLQRRLARMSVRLTVAALVIVSLVFFLGLLRGQELTLMLMTAMSMAVAAVPEGLPAVATISMALGARRMLRRNALIRNLPAVETLGSVTVICSDKTGTLTEGRMQVAVLRIADDTIDLRTLSDQGDAGPDPSAKWSDAPAALLLLGAALCNDAQIRDAQQSDAASDDAIVGDPTEVALLTVVARLGALKPELDAAFPRVAEAPFDPHRKRMTTVHALPEQNGSVHPLGSHALRAAEETGRGQYIEFLKGAVETTLAACDRTWSDGGWVPLDERRREQITADHDELASRGKRVLGFAFRWIDVAEALEEEFLFLGMVGIEDPPRAEATEAVRRCIEAGIRPVMITGDHGLTARYTAGKVGIATDHILTGVDMETRSDGDLEQAVADVSIYARVSPEHKLRIVEALQRNGQIVAMTGDGVNDAPALKAADIGVTMGITGTDVSKDAADTVLLDDNFATIVNAVEEGRIIYDNIRKFLKYTMTSNTGEIWVMLLAPFLGMPLPLVPLQILWINLVTDGLPGLAMAVEPAERDSMSRPPRAPDEPVFDRSMIIDIFWIGLLMGILSLGVGYWFWRGNPTSGYDASWGTIVFTVLTLSQIGNALATRAARDSLFKIGVLSNKPMLASVALTLTLQMMVVYVPSFQSVFRTTALSARDLVLCLVASTLVFWAVEARKWVRSISAR